MKTFLLEGMVFMMPIVMVFAFPFFVFFVSGEFLPATAVVERQNSSTQNILYMPAFTGVNEKQYKILETIEHNPEIAVFGRSRTLTFRSDFFKNNGSFYNAGVPMSRVSELRDFLNHIPKDAKLKVVLLDVSGFLKDTPVPEGTVQGGQPLTGVELFLTSGWREVYLSYMNKKFTISDLLKEIEKLPSIGLYALITHGGYRADGSLSRGGPTEITSLMKEVQSQIRESVAGIIPGKDIASFDSAAAPENLIEIGKFLDACRARNIYVIGYLSPYALEVYQKIQSLPGEQGDAIRKVPDQLSSIFNAHGYDFYDLRDLRMIGSSDQELYDVAHPTEKATMKLLLSVTKKEPVLDDYVDTSTLRQKITNEPF